MSKDRIVLTVVDFSTNTPYEAPVVAEKGKKILWKVVKDLIELEIDGTSWPPKLTQLDNFVRGSGTFASKGITLFMGDSSDTCLPSAISNYPLVNDHIVGDSTKSSFGPGYKPSYPYIHTCDSNKQGTQKLADIMEIPGSAGQLLEYGVDYTTPLHFKLIWAAHRLKYDKSDAEKMRFERVPGTTSKHILNGQKVYLKIDGDNVGKAKWHEGLRIADSESERATFSMDGPAERMGLIWGDVKYHKELLEDSFFELYSVRQSIGKLICCPQSSTQYMKSQSNVEEFDDKRLRSIDWLFMIVAVILVWVVIFLWLKKE